MSIGLVVALLPNKNMQKHYSYHSPRVVFLRVDKAAILYVDALFIKYLLISYFVSFESFVVLLLVWYIQSDIFCYRPDIIKQIVDLAQARSNSIANTLGVLRSCSNPSK